MILMILIITTSHHYPLPRLSVLLFAMVKWLLEEAVPQGPASEDVIYMVYQNLIIWIISILSIHRWSVYILNNISISIHSFETTELFCNTLCTYIIEIKYIGYIISHRIDTLVRLSTWFCMHLRCSTRWSQCHSYLAATITSSGMCIVDWMTIHIFSAWYQSENRWQSNKSIFWYVFKPLNNHKSKSLICLNDAVLYIWPDIWHAMIT